MTDFVQSNCTFTHEGRSYTAGGAYRVGDQALVYVAGNENRGNVTDWGSAVLGTYVVTSEWWSYSHKYGERSRMRSYRVTLADRSVWYGRHNSDWCQALKIKRASARKGK